MCLEGFDDRLGNFWTTLVGYLMHGLVTESTDPIQKIRMLNWNPDELTDPGVFTGFTPSADSAESVIFQQATDLWNREFPNIVMASSEQTAMSKYNELTAKIDAAGVAAYEKVISQRFQMRLKVMGKDKP